MKLVKDKKERNSLAQHQREGDNLSPTRNKYLRYTCICSVCAVQVSLSDRIRNSPFGCVCGEVELNANPLLLDARSLEVVMRYPLSFPLQPILVLLAHLRFCVDVEGTGFRVF